MFQPFNCNCGSVSIKSWIEIAPETRSAADRWQRWNCTQIEQVDCHSWTIGDGYIDHLQSMFDDPSVGCWDGDGKSQKRHAIAICWYKSAKKDRCEGYAKARGR